MNTFTSFDGIQIAYHDVGEGPAVILLHGGYVDGLASSEISNVFFRYWKSSKRSSGRCLGERFRFPILPTKEGPAWSAHY